LIITNIAPKSASRNFRISTIRLEEPNLPLEGRAD
jgi:hypothetical protein